MDTLKDLDVFTLLSIKTRIETQEPSKATDSNSRFLLYYPLKQGLKQLNEEITKKVVNDFYPTIH